MERICDYIREQNALKQSAHSQHSREMGQPRMELEEGFIPQLSPAEDIVQPPPLSSLKTEFKAASDVHLPFPTKADGYNQPYLSQYTDGKSQPYTPERINVHAQPFIPKQASPAISTPVAEPLAQYLAR